MWCSGIEQGSLTAAQARLVWRRQNLDRQVGHTAEPGGAAHQQADEVPHAFDETSLPQRADIDWV